MMQKLPAFLFLPVLLAGCSSTPPVAATSPVPKQDQPAESRKVSAAAKPVIPALNDLADDRAKRSVYFSYDNFIVDEKYKQMLRAHASYLTHNPASHITLQGNADERGSSEYNLALGQKRAEAVRKSLTLHGVPDRQIEAVSFGKERPAATCHEEKCWQENRRTDIAYPAVH
jgi:peptidoglycan-associated lipoprotein